MTRIHKSGRVEQIVVPGAGTRRLSIKEGKAPKTAQAEQRSRSARPHRGADKTHAGKTTTRRQVAVEPHGWGRMWDLRSAAAVLRMVADPTLMCRIAICVALFAFIRVTWEGAETVSDAATAFREELAMAENKRLVMIDYGGKPAGFVWDIMELACKVAQIIGEYSPGTITIASLAIATPALVAVASSPVTTAMIAPR